MLIAWLLANQPGPGPDPAGNIAPTGSPMHVTSTIEMLASNIDTWALIAAVVGIIVGAIIWAFGQFGQNYQQAVNGRKGVVVSALAALLIGAAPHVVDLLYGNGSKVF